MDDFFWASFGSISKGKKNFRNEASCWATFDDCSESSNCRRIQLKCHVCHSSFHTEQPILAVFMLKHFWAVLFAYSDLSCSPYESSYRLVVLEFLSTGAWMSGKSKIFFFSHWYVTPEIKPDFGTICLEGITAFTKLMGFQFCSPNNVTGCLNCFLCSPIHQSRMLVRIQSISAVRIVSLSSVMSFTDRTEMILSISSASN